MQAAVQLILKFEKINISLLLIPLSLNHVISKNLFVYYVLGCKWLHTILWPDSKDSSLVIASPRSGHVQLSMGKDPGPKTDTGKIQRLTLRLGNSHGVRNLEGELESLPCAWLPFFILRPQQNPRYQYLLSLECANEYQYLLSLECANEYSAPDQTGMHFQYQKFSSIAKAAEFIQISNKDNDAVFFDVEGVGRHSRRIEIVEVFRHEMLLNFFVYSRQIVSKKCENESSAKVDPGRTDGQPRDLLLLKHNSAGFDVFSVSSMLQVLSF